MSSKGYKHSAETLAKMSAAHKGQKLNEKQKQALIKSNKERVWTPEMREHMSIVQSGKKLSEEHKAKISIGCKGLKRSEETKKRMSIAHKNRIYKSLTEEHKNNIGKAHKGRVKSDKERRHLSEALMGHKLSEETKAKIGASHAGDKSYSWLGGKSFEPYPSEFNRSLKRKIRERDNNTCQLCDKTQEEESKLLAIHHIDYVKENCNPENLTTLCGSCNSKVNTNRKYWQKYFQNVMLNVV